MARRERTTALPRHRPRERAAGGRRFAGITWSEHTTRWAFIGGAAALLVLVVGLFLWGWYEDRFVKPNEVVLEVGDSDVKLSYYADRLGPWVRENASSGLSLALLEQSLLVKLEEEELTLLIARERGITITDDDITNAIAEELGVPVGGDGSPFDNLYRQRLKSTGMSDGNYRRLVKAQVADRRVRDQIGADIGESGEMITLRTVVVDSEEKAKAIRDRIAGGEDMGTIAQTESLDLQSRQADGIMQPEPAPLLPETIRTAIEGASEGDLSEPVQVANNWWVYRIEKRDPAGVYTEAQKAQLTDQEFTKFIEAKREATTVRKRLDGDDIEWAESHSS